MKASRKRRFQPSEASIREDEAANAAKASPRKTAKAFGTLSLQLSQEAQKGSKDAKSAVAKNQTRLNFVKKGQSTQLSAQPLSQPSAQPPLPRPSRAAAAPAVAEDSRQWSVKHAPAAAADLVVAKKKVAEVEQWLRATRDAPVGSRTQRVLLLTGPAGSGKSSVIRVLAADLGLDLCEWRPSASMAWSEHQQQPARQQDSLHFPYQSKLGEFEDFTARAKLPALVLTPSAAVAAASSPPRPSQSQPYSQQQQPRASQQQALPQPGDTVNGAAWAQPRPKLLVIDDLPHAGDAEQRRRLADALADALAAARFPTVLTATETTGRGGANGRETSTPEGLHPDLMRVVEEAGAMHVSLNPVTSAAVCKRLQAVAAAEGVALGTDDAKRVAEGCSGDLRTALETLQILCCGKAMKAPAAPASKGRRAKKPRKAATAAVLPPSAMAFIGQDAGLTLFHALGKLLYNKRDADGDPVPESQPSQPSACGAAQSISAQLAQQQQQGGKAVLDLVSDEEEQIHIAPNGSSRDAPGPGHWAWRRRPQCDAEAVLHQAGLEARSVAAFLHENVLEFVAEEGIDSAADVMAYLSDAERMACYWPGSSPGAAEADEYASSSMLDAAAGAVAARGVLFANVHQAPPRFYPMRAPALFAAHRACAQNRASLSSLLARSYTRGLAVGMTASVVSAEVLPAARQISGIAPGAAVEMYLPLRWARFYNGQVVHQQQRGGNFDVAEEQDSQADDHSVDDVEDIDPW